MGIAAFGTLLKQGDGGSPESFTTIAEVRDISGPGLHVNTDETTNHSSTGGYKEIVATIIDGGTIKFEINYDPAGATHDASTGLIADMVAKTKRNFQLVFSDTGSTTWTLPCYIIDFEPKAPVDGKLAADVTMEVSGQPTLA